MPSAWHTPDDPRELSDAPLVLACDGCGRDVAVAAEDWRDNDGHWCQRCVEEAVCAPHPVADWPEKVPA